MTLEWPRCVDCRRRRLSTWNGRRVGAATLPPAVPPARYLVRRRGTLGLDAQVCAPCQRATGDTILYDLQRRKAHD